MVSREMCVFVHGGFVHMEVSWNGGTAKSSMFLGFSMKWTIQLLGYHHDYGNPICSMSISLFAHVRSISNWEPHPRARKMETTFHPHDEIPPIWLSQNESLDQFDPTINQGSFGIQYDTSAKSDWPSLVQVGAPCHTEVGNTIKPLPLVSGDFFSSSKEPADTKKS